MNSITELQKQVRELEKAAGSGLSPDAAGTEALARRIVAAEYDNPEERYTAQALVIRLDRLRRAVTAGP